MHLVSLALGGRWRGAHHQHRTVGDRSNLWRLPLDGREPQRLTDFTDERLFWFEYSADGETLVVSSGQYLRDALLIRDFR